MGLIERVGLFILAQAFAVRFGLLEQDSDYRTFVVMLMIVMKP